MSHSRFGSTGFGSVRFDSGLVRFGGNTAQDPAAKKQAEGKKHAEKARQEQLQSLEIIEPF